MILSEVASRFNVGIHGVLLLASGAEVVYTVGQPSAVLYYDTGEKIEQSNVSLTEFNRLWAVEPRGRGMSPAELRAFMRSDRRISERP